MPKKRTVLIADDEREIRRALRMRLARHNYRVIEATNGLSVLTQYALQPLDAIILDDGMPAACGRDIARIIRKECDVPIVFLTGRDRERFREIVMQTPDTYYLPKPLDADRLLLLLGSLHAGEPSPAPPQQSQARQPHQRR